MASNASRRDTKKSDFKTFIAPNIGWVVDYSPPRWPDDRSLVHLDFLVDDLTTTEARVLAAGASRCDVQPNAEHCLVFTDPAGHPFCLTTVEELG